MTNAVGCPTKWPFSSPPFLQQSPYSTVEAENLLSQQTLRWRVGIRHDCCQWKLAARNYLVKAFLPKKRITRGTVSFFYCHAPCHAYVWCLEQWQPSWDHERKAWRQKPLCWIWEKKNGKNLIPYWYHLSIKPTLKPPTSKLLFYEILKSLVLKVFKGWSVNQL